MTLVMKPLKLISINIEGDRHWDTVIPLLRRESPDVVCLQEMHENALPRIEELGYNTSFLQMTLRIETGTSRAFGIAICSRLPILKTEQLYYHQAEVKTFDREDRHGSMSHGVLFASVIRDDVEFNLATTHFTWTKDGLMSGHQKTDLEQLLSALKEKEPHILTGDFNIPRGYNELYDELLTRYQDDIPKEYKTSVDLKFHKVKGDPVEAVRVSNYMVDYIFSQPPYQVSNVRLEFDISDHAAVVAEIART
jgi:endonuclease/exonuclease/phosphatase family metal-dependent hydrolase